MEAKKMKVWTRHACGAVVFALGLAVGAAGAEGVGWYRDWLANERCEEKIAEDEMAWILGRADGPRLLVADPCHR